MLHNRTRKSKEGLSLKIVDCRLKIAAGSSGKLLKLETRQPENEAIIRLFRMIRNRSKLSIGAGRDGIADWMAIQSAI